MNPCFSRLNLGVSIFLSEQQGEFAARNFGCYSKILETELKLRLFVPRKEDAKYAGSDNPRPSFSLRSLL